jgi:hypothetical protein
VTRIRVSTTIGAPPRAVWSALKDIASHVEWMDEALAIRFTSAKRHGVGTTFDCDTRVGPLQVTDRMEITEWRPGRAMGIVHSGVVTGSGRFTLRRRIGRGGGTRFTWEERLTFPWWMGGPVGAAVGSVVLRRIWRRNLANLKRRVETA